MVLRILRALFILLMAAIGWYFVKQQAEIVRAFNKQQADPLAFNVSQYAKVAIMATVVLGVMVVAFDTFSPRRKLAIFSGTFLGLIVGMLTAYALSFVVALLVDQFMTNVPAEQKTLVSNYANIMIGAICSYLAISFILQTKDDFRFIIPYVEFSKQTKGARPILLDTSVLIDGRIADIVETGMLDGRLIVPRFVLAELQTVADSADRLKRARGKRGLEMLQRLQTNKRAEIVIYDSSVREQNGPEDVDGKLMDLAAELNARVLTNDFNLNKVASLRGVDVVNINDLANALKPVVLPGERMTIRLIKPGESPGQGVGYLEDGTMVVVEQGRQHINEEVEFNVTSVLQTSAGKMIFGRIPDAHSRVG